MKFFERFPSSQVKTGLATFSFDRDVLLQSVVLSTGDMTSTGDVPLGSVVGVDRRGEVRFALPFRGVTRRVLDHPSDAQASWILDPSDAQASWMAIRRLHFLGAPGLKVHFLEVQEAVLEPSTSAIVVTRDGDVNYWSVNAAAFQTLVPLSEALRNYVMAPPNRENNGLSTDVRSLTLAAIRFAGP